MKRVASLIALSGSAAAIVAAGAFAPSRNAVAAEPKAPAATAPAAGFGTIKGRLVYGGDAPALPAVDTGGKEFCKDLKVVDRALEVDPKTKGVANAIVWVVSPKGKNPEAEKALLKKAPTVTIDNKDCEFSPRSTVMHKDQKLEFTSSDSVGHNSHVYATADSGCNLALAPKGKAAAPKFQPEKRPKQLKCDVHPWMTGHVFVADHPFFAVTDKEGNFTIEGVPAGTQNIIIWQEKVGFVNQGLVKGQPVEVKADATADMGDVKLDPSKVKK